MIELRGVKKKFEDSWVLHDIHITIPTGKLTCIVGRSGEGKSVLLKQIMGLIAPTEGAIIVDGVDTTTLNQKEIEKNFSKFGYVFQFAALIDSLDVFGNIGITLLEQGMAPSKVLPIVKEKLALVNLHESILYKYPSDLSGGMRKRVGLARTLLRQPRFMLYDEPTTGLDPITTRVIHELIRDVHHKLKLTSIIVSHDTSVFDYADYVALLYEGKIRFFGDAKTIWQSDNPYIYQFIRGLSQGPMTNDSVNMQQITCKSSMSQL
jgi:phospholipid/cholesterol/gamma-HCH transport system ATP-binding protein